MMFGFPLAVDMMDKEKLNEVQNYSIIYDI